MSCTNWNSIKQKVFRFLNSNLARISHKISDEDGRDVASDLLTMGREHCPRDKARPTGGEDGVTDRSDSPEVCEKCGLDPSRGVLLGLSGGPDSICLYHILLEYRKLNGITVSVAHVDHGWREESGKESERLETMSRDHGIDFYQTKLDSSLAATEDSARKARITFFEEVCRQSGSQAVLLAHHADDQAETVMKRLFEGASFSSCKGMQSISHLGNLTVWRPMLSVSKKEIESAVLEKGFHFFLDRTNDDPKYLRTRLRHSLIPYLSTEFGKEISKSLSFFASEAAEISSYLDLQIQPYLSKYVDQGLGGILDLSKDFPSSSILVKQILRRIFEKEHLCFSRDSLNTMASALIRGSANQRFMKNEKKVLIDRQRIYIQKKKVSLPDHEVKLTVGTLNFGSWRLLVERNSTTFEAKSSIWNGFCQVILPEGEYWIRKVAAEDRYTNHKPLKQWWSECRVPAFLRDLVPVIADQTSVVCEFLTGKGSLKNREKSYKVTLQLRT